MRSIMHFNVVQNPDDARWMDRRTGDALVVDSIKIPSMHIKVPHTTDGAF